MKLKALARLKETASDYEKLAPVGGPPDTLKKSWEAKLAVAEKALGPLKLGRFLFGTDVIYSNGGYEHMGRGSTTVKLFRAEMKREDGTPVTIDWKQGVSSMGTAWWIKVGNEKKVILPSNQFDALKDRLAGKPPATLNATVIKQVVAFFARAGLTPVTTKVQAWLGSKSVWLTFNAADRPMVVKLMTSHYGKPMKDQFGGGALAFIGAAEGVYVDSTAFVDRGNFTVRIVANGQALKRLMDI